MSQISMIAEKETLRGCDEFIHFINAVRDAKKGDEDAINLFKYLGLDFKHLHVVALFGLLLDRAPLEIDQAEALKHLLKIGAK